MNSYKLNGIAGHLCRSAIVNGLNITFCNIYKEVSHVTNDDIIVIKDGRRFKLKLEQVKDE
jgi:hypothetical protein